MAKHHYQPLPNTTDLLAIRAVLNNNGLATQEQFDDVRGRIAELSATVERMQKQFAPVHAMFAESVQVNRALTEQVRGLVNQVLTERHGIGQVREKLPSLQEIVTEVVEQTGRHTVITSERVRAMTQEEIAESRLKEDAETWRSMRKNVVRIAWRILGVLAIAGATYAAGHLEGRATAPQNTVAPGTK